MPYFSLTRKWHCCMAGSSFREPESTKQSNVSHSGNYKSEFNRANKGHQKENLKFPPEMWFNFAGECGARPSAVNHFLFFFQAAVQHFVFRFCPLSCNSLPLSLNQVIEFDDGSGSVLRIQPLRTPRDEAIYECHASNSAGEITASTRLSVLRGQREEKPCY